MRQSLLFSGLESVIYNINRKKTSLKFFEFGKTYHQYESGKNEHKHVTLFVSGLANKERWNAVSKNSNFFYLKGIVKTILFRLGIKDVKPVPTKNDVFSEGLTLSLGKTKLVDLGVVKKSILKEFGIKQEVLFADFNWENVLKLVGSSKLKVKLLPKYPSVKRDFALLLNKEVTFNEIYNLAYQAERNLLKEVDLFDVYEGDKLPEGKKSYAISFLLQDKDKTLNDKQIDKIMERFKQTFEKNVGATLR